MRTVVADAIQTFVSSGRPGPTTFSQFRRAGHASDVVFITAGVVPAVIAALSTYVLQRRAQLSVR